MAMTCQFKFIVLLSENSRKENIPTDTSHSDWTVRGSNVSYPSFLPTSPSKQFQFVSTMNNSTMNTRTSSIPRTMSYYTGEGDDDGISTCSCSDISHQKSKESSFRSLMTDDHSWMTDQSSSLNASIYFSSGSQVNINFELEQLRMELRHVQGMYAKVQTEAMYASRQLNNLHHQQLEETLKLKEINLKEEEAKELAEQEKARYESAKREAEYAKECTVKEAALRAAAAEKKTKRDAKAREKLEYSLVGPVLHYQEFTWEEIASATSSFSNHLRVGMGSYGTVYNCSLRRTTAAVKILHSTAVNGTKQFRQEV